MDKLELGQQVDIARIKLKLSQGKLIKMLKREGVKMDASTFSKKKSWNAFDDNEIVALNKILNVKLEQ